MRIKKTASTQTITASVSSQPAMSCHAGRVNRKKFSGLPKIGSTTPLLVTRCVPKKRERRPLRHHGGAGCSGNDERNAERDEPQNRLNRQPHRLSADENRVTDRQIGEMCPLQSQKRSVQNEKCGRCKSREDSPLKTQCFPEHVPIAERPEPEHVHVIRQRGPTAEDDAGEDRRE